MFFIVQAPVRLWTTHKNLEQGALMRRSTLLSLPLPQLAFPDFGNVNTAFVTLACTAKMCFERWCFLANCIWQTVHSNDFLFSCTDSMWRSRWSLRVKRFGHCWQANALDAVLSSSWRARMWARRWCFWENFCPHWVQSNGRTFSWTADTCFCKWSFLVNLASILLNFFF